MEGAVVRERAPAKIALCIPCYGDTKARFTQSLAAMIAHFLSADITTPEGEPIARDVKTFMVASSMLTQSRHMLVAEALAWGADHLLWLDADHVFPEDALARLWARNLPIVGCNYARRCHPTAPTAARTIDGTNDHRNLVYTTPRKAADDLIEEVDHIGLGLCLMDMRILDLLQHRAEEDGRDSFLPLFHFETKPDGFGIIGEDVYFFRKLREAGVPVHVDHALSWEVGHLHEQIMTNALAVAHEEKWVASTMERARQQRAETLAAAG